MRKQTVLMLMSILVLSAGKCEDDSTPATGSKGGPCYSNLTCDQGLVCVNESECLPSSGGSNETGSGDEDSITLAEAMEETAEILCDRLVVCFGKENVDSDCEDTLERAFTNEGCKNFDAEQAEPCLDCLDDDLDCTEVQGIIVYGYPLHMYCNVCDLMCDK